MHQQDRIDGAAVALRKTDAVLGMMLQIGPDAQLEQVMQAVSLAREEMNRALSLLEDEGDSECALSEGPIGWPLPATPAVPAQGGAAVVNLRPSQRG